MVKFEYRYVLIILMNDGGDYGVFRLIFLFFYILDIEIEKYFILKSYTFIYYFFKRVIFLDVNFVRFNIICI